MEAPQKEGGEKSGLYTGCVDTDSSSPMELTTAGGDGRVGKGVQCLFTFSEKNEKVNPLSNVFIKVRGSPLSPMFFF